MNVLASSFRGKGGTPSVEVSGGPGATCDLSGTLFQNATLTTSYDSVVGPG